MFGGFQSLSFSLLLQGLLRNNLLLVSLLVAVPVSVQAEEAASSDLGAAISVVTGGGGANIGGDANTVEGVGEGAGGPGDGEGPGEGAGQGLGQGGDEGKNGKKENKNDKIENKGGWAPVTILEIVKNRAVVLKK